MATPISGSRPLNLPGISSIKDEQASRRYPLAYPLDTVRIFTDSQGRRVKEPYNLYNIFEDKEILKHHLVIRQELMGRCTNKYEKEEDVYVDFTENDKAVIQQQSTRGCVVATAAMLIKDQGGEFQFSELSDDFGNDKDIKQDIRTAGFEPVVTQFQSNSLESLRKQLLKSGSAIVTIWDPQAGNHSIVVDEVSEDLRQVRLRDPYHGWEITVSAEAFQSRWQGNQQIVQIENKKRRYPPVSPLDTAVIFTDSQGRQVKESCHGTCSVFEDKEILKHHPVTRRELVGQCANKYEEEEDVYIDFTENGKAIIQQQATRGCVAATAAMLIKDQKKEFDFFGLSVCNLGNDEDTKQYIRTAGLKPIVNQLASLEALRKQLLKSGSAIASIIDPQAGGHSIVVDEVSEDLQQVRLRDPYHGWEITVSAKAFQLRWSSGNVIQIEEPDVKL